MLERWKRRRVPSPAECRAIYAMLDVDERILRHSRVVADTAGNMANDLNRAGCNLDKDLIVAAALLHDIARERPDHAHQGARLVAELGFPEAGELISTHIDIPAHPNGEVNAAEVLYLADKLVQEDKKVSLEKRFGSKLAVHMDDARAVNKIISRSSTAFYIESRVAALIQGRINAPVSGKK